MLDDQLPEDTIPHSATGVTAQLGEALSFLSVLVVTLTIAVVPWILGGAIPQASLVLQSGAVLASVLALGSMFLSRRFPRRLPVTCLPFVGFCLIGLLQLLPVYNHPALEMKHAVLPELATALPATQKSTDGTPASVRSVMPAETRLTISQMLSLTLLSVTLFEMARTRRQILIVVVGLVLSGCGMSALALSQQMGAVAVVIGNHWKISDTTPFGCFVNPNNAAGWLMICLSGSLLLCGISFGSESQSTFRTSRRSSFSRDVIPMAWRNLVSRVASMNSAQVLAASSAILLIAGIAATLSRAGIVAAILGMIAFVLSRFSTGRWVFAIGSLTVIMVLACLFLALMDLDTVIVSELRTLKDPVSESTGRLLHWTDSLRSSLDFPLLGSGLGGYRYGSLPYQRHYTGKWFQRADNQFVEVVVESGLAGFACFVGFGIISLVLVRRVMNSSAPGRRTKTSSLRDWSASAVLYSVVAIAGAAFFDYGISLPSVAGAIAVLVVMLERQAIDLKESKSDFGSNEKGFEGTSAGPYLAVWISLLVSAAILIPDTFAAARIYSSLAPVQRLVDHPDVQILSDKGDLLLANLDAAMASRPDDDLSRRIRVLFLELLFRQEMLRRMSAGREMSTKDWENGFRRLNTASIADLVLDSLTPEATRSNIRNEFKLILERYPWRESGRNLLRESAWTLTVPTDLALCDLLLGDQALAQVNVNHIRFAEPHGASSLFLIGHALLKAGRIEICRACWDQSLSVSETFRPLMLREAAKTMGADVAIDWLLPDSYEPCAKAAIGFRGEKALKQRLFGQADLLWENARPRLTESLALTRALHLDAEGAADAAADWLSECLQEMPENLSLRKRRALLLEKCGKNSEAYDEWLRVQSSNFRDTEAEKALKRLIRLPPTTLRRQG